MFVQGPAVVQQRSENSDEGSDEEVSGDVLQRRREECERKARRGEMDPRLEFAFQLLMDATGLPRHEVMDHVFEGDMLDEINQLFLPHMKSTLMWFYQEVEEPEVQRSTEIQGPTKTTGTRPQQNAAVAKVKEVKEPKEPRKKKLFLTDGWQVPCTGICVYMFRINISKQLPEEGFQKDLYTGVIDATKVGIIPYIQRVIERVFMDALAHPGVEDEDDCPMIKSVLLPGLRSFCSALKVCEEVVRDGSIFDDGQSMMEEVRDAESAKIFLSNEGAAERVEERVRGWIKKLKDFMLESKQVRRENDSSGPQQELEYWKRRGSQFSQLVARLQDDEVKMSLLCLQVSRSKLLKEWEDMEEEVTYCFNEAKDNAKFIQALEKCCHCLYLDDPVRMRDSLVSLLQTVRLIYSVSRYYNTSERTSSLMVKITNQMIAACRDYVTMRGRETVWGQDRTSARAYRETYRLVRCSPAITEEEFSFSETHVFGRFDSFCARIRKILTMFDLIEDYQKLFERRMEGLLLGEALDETIKTFEEAKKIATSKNYDYLDPRNVEFDNDYDNFMARTDTLKQKVGDIIEKNYADVWETPQGIRFLTRFEKALKFSP